MRWHCVSSEDLGFEMIPGAKTPGFVKGFSIEAENIG